MQVETGRSWPAWAMQCSTEVRCRADDLVRRLAGSKAQRDLLWPGGKLVVIDSDDDLSGLVEPALPELGRLQQKIALIQTLRGDDRRVGRKLWRLLEDAGFSGLEQEAIVSSSDAQGPEPFLAQLDPERLAPLRREGLLLDDDLTLAQAARARLLAAERPVVMSLLLLVCGTKPMTAATTR